MKELLIEVPKNLLIMRLTAILSSSAFLHAGAGIYPDGKSIRIQTCPGQSL